MNLQLIAGLYDFLKAGIIDAGKEVKRAVIALLFSQTGQGQHGAGLSHGFNNQNTGHDGTFREMALELRFIGRDVFDDNSRRQVVRHTFHTVNQQKRITVRKIFHNILNVVFHFLIFPFGCLLILPKPLQALLSAYASQANV